MNYHLELETILPQTGFSPSTLQSELGSAICSVGWHFSISVEISHYRFSDDHQCVCFTGLWVTKCQKKIWKDNLWRIASYTIIMISPSFGSSIWTWLIHVYCFQDYVNMLMPPLIDKWNYLKDEDKDLFPLLEVRYLNFYKLWFLFIYCLSSN